MPIDDERHFTVTKKYHHEVQSPPVQLRVDPVQEGLDRLRTVLEASKQDRIIAESKAREREKLREEAERTRLDRDDKYKKLQQMLHRVKEMDDDRRQAEAERQAHGRCTSGFCVVLDDITVPQK